MRLIDITQFATNIRESLISIQEWREVQISESIKTDLKRIYPEIYKLNNYTGIISIGSGNITIFPYQYFLICVLIKPLASIIIDYKTLLEKLIVDCKDQNIDIAKIIVKKTNGESDPDVSAFDTLINNQNYRDSNIDLLVRLLTDENYRMKAKSIANFNGGSYKLRGFEDFFGSIFLKIINVPNASSSILGDIIFKLSEYKLLFNKLCEELRPSLPFILKEKTLNNFIYFLFLFLKAENKLESILANLTPNNDPKYVSIEKGSKKLTSIFWSFDHLASKEELSQGNNKRCFEEPIFIKENKYYYLSTEWTNTGTSRLDFETFKEIFNEVYKSSFFVEYESANYFLKSNSQKKAYIELVNVLKEKFTSIKTKPFIILAGISGTGKSRLVRKLAYEFCNNDELKKDEKPGNFELVKVKPNWHDSTELLGYESRISGKDRYIVTDFLKFIIKAWQYPDTPFFLCLDEMNLAPVEQYFAEYLSVIETRDLKEGKIITDSIVNKSLFERYADKTTETDPDFDLWKELNINDEELKKKLLEYGLTLPPNLIVMGTVNMDETTHSFSRKVLDRAMTIEMTVDDLYSGLTDDRDYWDYPDTPFNKKLVISEKTDGWQVYNEFVSDANLIIKYLELLNDKLEGTPFKIAYRVRDEFLLYAYNVMQNESKSENWLNEVKDEMTLMKILPRIEGDEEKTAVLMDLIEIFKNEGLENSLEKAFKMNMKRTSFHYTSYWD